MEDLYRTISSEGKSVFKDRGSKFLGFAFPVTSEEEIKEILDKLRKEFHDARHHCYAWKLGYSGESWRANDDGEPSSSAGKPILQQIIARDLTNVLVVVIRYFGGVLLGVGGLINAYKIAASDALEQSSIVDKFIEEIICVTFDYPQTSEIMRILSEKGAKIIRQEFIEKCHFHISIKKSICGNLILSLNSIENTTAKSILTENS